jgi:hypothetical protein
MNRESMGNADVPEDQVREGMGRRPPKTLPESRAIEGGVRRTIPTA